MTFRDIVYTLAFLGVGLYFFVSAVAGLFTARESVRWPSVEGRVVESKLEVWRDSGGSRQYRPRVSYRYRVGGRAYSSERIEAGESPSGSASRDLAAKVLEAYPAGKVVLVQYDPDNPASALLKPGEAGSAWGSFWVGLVFVLIGAGLGWRTYRKEMKRRKQDPLGLWS